MIPCLYKAAETEFKTNGIGKLADCISCVVSEKRNDSYLLKMTYPSDGIHADDLTEENIILAKPAEGKDPQPFRIYQVTASLDGMLEIAAWHLSYQLNSITVSPTEVSGTVTDGSADRVLQAFAALKANASVECPFTFETDLESTLDFSIGEPVSFRKALGGAEGSMLDTFGGEFEWDFYTVRLLSRRGADRSVRIVYGKNLTDFKRVQDSGSVITGCHPYWVDAETRAVTELPERVVLLEHDRPYDHIAPLDCTEHFEEEPSYEELRAYAQAQLQNTSATEPSIDITVDFVQLSQLPGYEDIAAAEHVNLCDTVHVFVSRLGIELAMSVTETEYDSLLERWNSITLSNALTYSRNSSLVQTLDTGERISASIKTAVMKASADLTYTTKTYANRIVSQLWNKVETEYALEDAVSAADAQILAQAQSYADQAFSSLELSVNAICSELQTNYTTNEASAQILLDAQAYADRTVASLSLKVSGSLGGTASIELTTDGSASSTLDLSGVRSAFANDTTAITISGGRITFNSNTFLVNSTNLTITANGSITASNVDLSGKLTATSGNCTAKLSGGSLLLCYEDIEYGGLVASYYAGDAAMRGVSIHLRAAGSYISFGQDSNSDGTTTWAYLINYGLNPSGYEERHILYSNARILGHLCFGSLDSAYYLTGLSSGGVYCSGDFSTVGNLLVGNSNYGSSYMLHVKGGAYFNGTINVSGTNYTSDENEKTDVEDIAPCYEDLFLDLRPVTYRFKNFTEEDHHDRVHCGLLAQTTLAAANAHGLDSMTFAAVCRDDLEEPTVDGRTERYGMAYAELAGLTIHMVQKLYARVEELEDELSALKEGSP